MDDMKILCGLIVELLNGYSEDFLEDGELNLSFDCKGYHYECDMKRTLKEGEEDE